VCTHVARENELYNLTEGIAGEDEEYRKTEQKSVRRRGEEHVCSRNGE
jgi:hypothetical protein